VDDEFNADDGASYREQCKKIKGKKVKNKCFLMKMEKRTFQSREKKNDK